MAKRSKASQFKQAVIQHLVYRHKKAHGDVIRWLAANPNFVTEMMNNETSATKAANIARVRITNG
jgi:hypothetical protein